MTCHDIPLGGSGSSVTAAIPLPLGSTFSQSDSVVIPIPIPFRCLCDLMGHPAGEFRNRTNIHTSLQKIFRIKGRIVILTSVSKQPW